MPLIRNLPGTIDLLNLHRHDPEKYPYLLQSVARENLQGRFDILFANPGETLSLTRESISSSPDFLEQLDQVWRDHRISDATDSDIPFRGGWFLYLGYELAGQIEPGNCMLSAGDGLPIAYAVRIPAAVIVDHQQKNTLLVSEAGKASLLEDLALDVAAMAGEYSPLTVSVDMVEDLPARYIEGIKRIKQYIVDGDVFQVNLARRWQGRLSGPIPSAEIYRRLRIQNPGAFAGLAIIDGNAAISSSPERLVRVSNGIAETRPIAGTRPRGENNDLDQVLQRELLANNKERAEHVMLIDLERNDLGRVCVPGSVLVDEFMALETYAHVHHIVSNVRGSLRHDVTPGEVIRAVFPGGTITGCPKVRCMQIISELEGVGRGAYTGSMGYLNHNGDMDLNILIRTIVQSGNSVSLHAGAGIVADSVPDKELQETRDKAKGLLLALGGTHPVI